jgi:GDPmannose 4,6-dehydratase
VDQIGDILLSSTAFRRHARIPAIAEAGRRSTGRVRPPERTSGLSSKSWFALSCPRMREVEPPVPTTNPCLNILQELNVAKKAFITGITGQDGSYLAEYLLSLGYDVHGLVRRVALEDPLHRLHRINHIIDKITLQSGSLESYASIFQIVAQNQYDECYHLAAQSFVAESFADGFSTMHTNVTGTHYVLAALREANPHCRFYFAGSSEMYGRVHETPQTETTPFHPRSPYGISKVAGYYLTLNYREAYDMFCCSGILFNHESPRRGLEFVTRKISNGVARIKCGLATELALGNLDARRDWGHAEEYVRAMHAMLQQDTPDDYVVGTGETHSVQEFCELAFASVGLDYRDHVRVDPAFFRPAEVDLLVSNPAKAHRELGWEPKKGFAELVREMVTADVARHTR